MRKIDAIDGMITVVHLRGEPENLKDTDLICAILQDLVKTIGMQAHGNPVVVHYPDNSNAKGTVTIFQCLHESFVVYDNWPEFGYAHVIIDSCRRYSLDAVLEFFRLFTPFEAAVAAEGPIYYPGEEKHGR